MIKNQRLKIYIYILHRNDIVMMSELGNVDGKKVRGGFFQLFPFDPIDLCTHHKMDMEGTLKVEWHRRRNFI